MLFRKSRICRHVVAAFLAAATLSRVNTKMPIPEVRNAFKSKQKRFKSVLPSLGSTLPSFSYDDLLESLVLDPKKEIGVAKYGQKGADVTRYKFLEVKEALSEESIRKEQERQRKRAEKKERKRIQAEKTKKREEDRQKQRREVAMARDERRMQKLQLRREKRRKEAEEVNARYSKLSKKPSGKASKFERCVVCDKTASQVQGDTTWTQCDGPGDACFRWVMNTCDLQGTQNKSKHYHCPNCRRNQK